MHKDTENAKVTLEKDGFTCVLCHGETLLTSNARGVKPLVEYINDGIDLNGFCGADKIIGRAAAFLFILVGIKEVYAQTLSCGALEVLSSRNIPVYYSELTERIVNRAGTGLCPMETAVAGIDSPDLAYKAITEALRKLQKRPI